MTLSSSRARKWTTHFGWLMIQRGYEFPSRNGKWWVYKAGHLYKARRTRGY